MHISLSFPFSFTIFILKTENGARSLRCQQAFDPPTSSEILPQKEDPLSVITGLS